MKIDLAVWTAVNGYEWQPGSVYPQRELAGYKDAIGPLEPYSLPLGGLFLKDGKAVFYRVQIAERMDSRGRGAVYLVLGAIPAGRAAEVDFAEIFNSPEMSKPRKPFPTAIEHNAKPRECRTPLGRGGFAERRFNGARIFSDLGGWCAEAKGGKLNVRITGTMESPLFTVGYAPSVASAPVFPVGYATSVAPAPVRKEPEWPRERHSPADGRGEPLRPERPPHREAGPMGGVDKFSLTLGFALGIVLSLLVFLAVSKIDGKRPNGEDNPKRDGRAKIAKTVRRDKDGDALAGSEGDEQGRQNQEREEQERR